MIMATMREVDELWIEYVSILPDLKHLNSFDLIRAERAFCAGVHAGLTIARRALKLERSGPNELSKLAGDAP